MPRFIAFLRAINVGGRNIKMDDLRALLEAMGLTNVETFIASGNVIFGPPTGKANGNPKTLPLSSLGVTTVYSKGMARKRASYDLKRSRHPE